jgi:hypothetical protein
MSIIDTAIQRVQTLAQACAFDATARKVGAPDYPPEDAATLPLSVAYIASGTATDLEATSTKLIINIGCDVHFDRQILKQTYKMIDTFIPDFVQRLGGDPTLGGSVSTIVYPVTFSVTPAEWNTVVTQCVSFVIPVKFNLLTPTVTA